MNLILVSALTLALALMLIAQQGACQRNNNGDSSDNDDFDDAGFDDSGYNSPQPVEADGSNQNQNYSPSSEEDLDDDDDVDETSMRPQVATGDEQHNQIQTQTQTQTQQNPSNLVANSEPRQFYDSVQGIMLPRMDNDVNQQASKWAFNGHQPRFRRSINRHDNEDNQEMDIEQADSGTRQVLVRRKRHSKYIGPVYTYVKTDKHARYKWGVKHKVGSKKHGK